MNIFTNPPALVVFNISPHARHGYFQKGEPLYPPLQRRPLRNPSLQEANGDEAIQNSGSTPTGHESLGIVLRPRRFAARDDV